MFKVRVVLLQLQQYNLDFVMVSFKPVTAGLRLDLLHLRVSVAFLRHAA